MNHRKVPSQEGRMHGVGEMTWPSGDKYIGDWEQDNRQGFGLYLFASGNRYKGSYVRNKKQELDDLTFIYHSCI